VPATHVHLTTDALVDATAGKYCTQRETQSCSRDFRQIGAGGKNPPVKAPAAEAEHQTSGQGKAKQRRNFHL